VTALYLACLLPSVLASPTDCMVGDIPVTDSLVVEIQATYQSYVGIYLAYGVTGESLQVNLALPPFPDTADDVFDVTVRVKRSNGGDWSCWSPNFSGRTALLSPPGDSNGDGLVNLVDLGFFTLCQKAGGPSYFDFDGNGETNVADLARWAYYQAHPPQVLYPELP